MKFISRLTAPNTYLFIVRQKRGQPKNYPRNPGGKSPNLAEEEKFPRKSLTQRRRVVFDVRQTRRGATNVLFSRMNMDGTHAFKTLFAIPDYGF